MKNWLISAVTLFLLYVILEIFCLDIFFRTLSHGAYPFLDEGVSFSLQPTKRSLMPKDYVAIVGDSYAMGLGDEYYLGNATLRAEYGSAPFLHKTLRQDVISFGTAGNSSISGMVTQPVLAQKFFNKGWRTALEAPEKILVYFYEGNDFSDNVEYFHYTRKRVKFQYDKIEDREYFARYIQEAAIDTHPWNKTIEDLRWYQQLYLAKFIGKAVVVVAAHLASLLESAEEISSAEISADHSPLNMNGRFGWKSPGTINQVRVNGVVTQIPDKVQGPSSLVLNEEEKILSLLAYREALRFMKKYFPDAAITVVYVPSVVSTYDIASSQVSMQHFRQEAGGLYSSDEVRQQSDWGAQHIRALTEEEGVDFIDARPQLREAAKNQLLHGPYDWNHFNKEGYRALADAILQEIVSP
jgi:hypothetical protein